MNKLKILVVGAGSVGCRHIENLLSLGTEVSAFRYRSDLKSELSRKYGIDVYDSLDEALSSELNAVVIANRTSQHIDSAIKALRKGLHVFIEKPLSHNLQGIEELERTAKSKDLVVEVGCMMRFNPGLKLIRQLIREKAIGVPYFARAYAGQYLPDWRPADDYRHSYSAKLNDGGGVLFDLIHEVDYLYWLFGEASEVSAFLDHVSDLEIETEDMAQVLIRFKNRIVAHVEMDYISPVFRRGCEIVGGDGVIAWDYSTGRVILVRREKSEPKIFQDPDSFTRNEMFLDHMKYFIERIQKGGDPAVSLEDAIHVLKIALAAHKSSHEGIHARPGDLVTEAS